MQPKFENASYNNQNNCWQKTKIICTYCDLQEAKKRLFEVGKLKGVIIHESSIKNYKNQNSIVEYTCSDGHLSKTKAQYLLATDSIGCNQCFGYKG